MKNVHKMSKVECIAMAAHHNKRKPYEWKNPRRAPKEPDRHLAHKCPLPGCGSIVQRLVPHLVGFHKLEKRTEEFARLQKRAVIIERKPGMPKVKRRKEIREEDAIREEEQSSEDDEGDADISVFQFQFLFYMNYQSVLNAILQLYTTYTHKYTHNYRRNLKYTATERQTTRKLQEKKNITKLYLEMTD